MRPNYETVRLIARCASRCARARPRQTLVKVIDTLYEYPAPGLGGWYDRYRRGAV